MSTRSNIHFCWETKDAIAANVYRHSDGYPDGEHGFPADFARFLEAVKRDTADTRCNHPEYLAAKYVVWQANENAKDRAESFAKEGETPQPKMLDFLSVGVCVQDHTDIAFRYHVLCPTGYGQDPTLEWEEAR